MFQSTLDDKKTGETISATRTAAQTAKTHDNLIMPRIGSPADWRTIIITFCP
jgi:hypothetical protein